MNHRLAILCACVTVVGFANAQLVRAELPNPVLTGAYPSGLQAGGSANVLIEGAALEEITDLRCTAPGFTCEKSVDPKKPGTRFIVAVPDTTPPGLYEIRAVGRHGVSSPRTFVVSRLNEVIETEPDAALETPNLVPLDTAASGKIEKAGDVDRFRFAAKAGERVVVECWAARIDSLLRPVIEIYDARGRRLAVNRGFHGPDPLIDFTAPDAGDYDVRLFDLTFSGGPTHFYRLDLDTQPRPDFALPCVVERGKPANLTIFGRNLAPASASQASNMSTAEKSPPLDFMKANITSPVTADPGLPLMQSPAHFAADSFAYHHSAGHMPLAIGLTDVPVVENIAGHETRESALELPIPCEVSGLVDPISGRHWYSVAVKRGEVLWFEAFAQRIGSPLDLELTIFDADGKRELTRISGEQHDLGGYRFSTSHVDPVGRWVAPADGRFYVFVRDVVVGSSPDPRRVYRLSVRREEPSFELAVVSRRTDQPAGFNVSRGGREWLEVLALRRRGLTGPIRISVAGLPPGVECPDVWIGPEQDRAPLVVTASADAASFVGPIEVVGRFDQDGLALERRARSGTMILPGRPTPSGRLAQELPLAVAGEVPFTLAAAPASAAIDQEDVLEVELSLDARGERPLAPFRLTSVGLPADVAFEAIEVAPETGKAWLSFTFPASLPPGKYTFAVSTEIEAMLAPKPGTKPAKTKLTLVSNPITVELKPARVVLALDPSSPTKIARGKIMQLKFSLKRTGGFIGKIHVELAAPGGVVGVRARGTTLVGQDEDGTLQVIATDNAPLGRLSQLRLEAVGTVEDQPIYRAGKPIELEIIE